MHKPPMKQTVQQLYLSGKSIREISRILELSRNTVRAILRKNDPPTRDVYPSNPDEHELLDLIKPLLASCKGNLIRVHEILAQEHQKNLPYSTLTWLVRKYQLREIPRQRVGEYEFAPGVEMQHDTSPHWVEIDGKKTKAQCASLIFGFSRKVFVQYYPRFTRFEAKVFLHDALVFMGASCQRCIIDNTSVILAAGAGAHAVVSPEMLFFSRVFGFKFVAHAVNDPDRKGKVERPFQYAENNFLAGRTFRDWRDLNEQVHTWCEQVANKKIKRVLGTSPDILYQSEAERLLTGHHATLDLYIQQLKSHVRGRGAQVFKQLLYFKQIYPVDAFMSAITTAQQYHLYDMKRLESIILRFISTDFFNF